VLDYRTYGFTEQDLEKSFFIDLPNQGAILSRTKDWKLKDLIQALENAYCKKIGVEFNHMTERAQRDWIRQKFEAIQYETLDEETRVHMFKRLNASQMWGDFMAQKFNTTKRFGLEGVWSFVPGMKYGIDKLCELGAETFVFGMPHRGRMNTLANVIRKPMVQLMAEFQGITPDAALSGGFVGAGDAKYHLGTTYRRKYGSTEKDVKLTLLANPSHLETVAPVVCGRARAEQHFLGGSE
jgi:2-oxoglutarate dehydrogenase E1 component